MFTPPIESLSVQVAIMISFPFSPHLSHLRDARQADKKQLPMMQTKTVEQVLQILKKEIKKWKVPAVGVIADEALDRPFGTLISCVLSLRTKDAVTEVASHRLLSQAPTPQAMVKLTPSAIEKLIYPVGFYRTKAKSIIKTCRIL